MRLNLLFIPLMVFLLLAGILFIQLTQNTRGFELGRLESMLSGKKIPLFKLQDLEKENKIYDSALFYTGTPTLLNLWATWCPTCRAEHEYLHQLAARGIRIIGLNYKDDRMKAVQWLNRFGNPYVLSLYDGDGMLGLELGVYGAPETFLIDGQGIIRYRHAGELNEQVWQQHMLPLYQQYQGDK